MTVGFRKHKSSAFHKEAVEKLITLPATTGNIGEMLSALHTSKKAENYKCLLTVLSNLKFLARQNCAIFVDIATVTVTSTNYSSLKLEVLMGPSFWSGWLKRRKSIYKSWNTK